MRGLVSFLLGRGCIVEGGLKASTIYHFTHMPPAQPLFPLRYLGPLDLIPKRGACNFVVACFVLRVCALLPKRCCEVRAKKWFIGNVDDVICLFCVPLAQ